MGLGEDQDLDEVLEKVDSDERVTVNDDGTKTVKLEEPIEFKKDLIESLTFRKPTGRDWRSTDQEKGELAKAYRLAASLCGESMGVFDKMCGNDALFCCQVASTMGKKSKTGGSS